MKHSNQWGRKQKRPRLQLKTKNQINYTDLDSDDDNEKFVEYNDCDKKSNFSSRNENDLKIIEQFRENDEENAFHTVEDIEFSMINSENSNIEIDINGDNDDDDGVYQIIVNQVAADIKNEKVQKTTKYNGKLRNNSKSSIDDEIRKNNNNVNNGKGKEEDYKKMEEAIDDTIEFQKVRNIFLLIILLLVM